MVALRTPTDPRWTQRVMDDFDAFLVDHAACERKASATGMAFVVRYPDRPAILDAIIEFAREELDHFHQIYRVLAARGLRLGPDTPDPYVGALRPWIRPGRDERLLDRLLVAAVVEARGCERFGLVARALPAGELRTLYEQLTRSEARHHGLFVRLARECFPAPVVQARLDALVDAEAEIVASLPLRPALH